MTIEAFVPSWGEYAYDHLVRRGSDFQAKLGRWLDGEKPTDEDGDIAVVVDQGEAVAWARSECWKSWNTLEAYTRESHRMRGLAAWASTGLFAESLHMDNSVAVFRPIMLLVAKRAGLHPTLFERDWVKSD